MTMQAHRQAARRRAMLNGFRQGLATSMSGGKSPDVDRTIRALMVSESSAKSLLKDSTPPISPESPASK